jgi:hypothetical protein
MTTDHINTCKNNCIYATKVVFLSRAGEAEDWLYRCTKLEERVITTDSVIHKLGCATFTTGRPVDNQDDLVKRAQEMLNEINQKIGEDKKKEVPVSEPIKPVVNPSNSTGLEAGVKESLTTPPPIATPLPNPVVQSTPTPQVTITEEPVKKKRGRKPKQVTVEPQVSVAPEIPKEPIKEEVIKDGGTTEGTKL